MRLALAVVFALCAPRLGAQEDFDELFAAAAAAQAAGADDATNRANYARAVAAFLDLDPAQPGFDERLQRAAQAAYLAAQFERAVEWHTLAIARLGANDSLVDWHLWSLLRAGRRVEALEMAQRFEAEFRPTVDRFLGGDRGFGQAELHAAAGSLLRRGETDLGLWYFRKLVFTSGEHAVPLGNLALALRYLGRIDECERTYERALAKDPGDELIWNDLGLFYKGIGRIQDAIAALRKSVSVEEPPIDGPATSSLAILQRRGHDAGLDDPAVAVARILRTMPDAALARRRCIDAIVDS